jgi:hypothetical protein
LNKKFNGRLFYGEVKMKQLVFIFFFAGWFMLLMMSKALAGDDVKITAKAANDTVRAGKETRLIFQIHPKEGLHINIEPAIKLALTDAKNFTLVMEKFVPDSASKTVTTKDGYKIFDPKHAQPVAFAVKVAKGAKPGKYPLKAKLTYYYCSDAEGWCSFANQEFLFNLVVIK